MMLCQSCGTRYEDDDGSTSYYFESASFPKGSDASPSAIFLEGEDITFCPRCRVGDLYDVTRRMDDLVPGTFVPKGRYPEKEEPDPGEGDATVTHRPIY